MPGEEKTAYPPAEPPRITTRSESISAYFGDTSSLTA